MDHNERKAWLKTLKVGDEVTYHVSYRGDTITKIARITPTGQIKTENGYTFRDGYCNNVSWSGAWLFPVTDDVRKQIYDREIYRKVINTKWDQVGIDKLERIAEILYGSGEDETT